MDESESGAGHGGALNAAVPASPESIEAIRQLLAEAAKVSRELGQLAEDMVAQSEAGRREAQRLIEGLAEAAKAIAEEAAETAPAPKSVAPTRSTGSDGARLLARQMLANGTDRETVERNLTTSFHVEDAAAVVDSILP
jgi:hypothetical protein